ncbi:MAG: acetyl-CoA hydrolase/transferase family protein [Dehalococcoidia bacterium]
MDWETEYKRKLVSAEEAVKIVKSGDLVMLPLPSQPAILQNALAARVAELKNVRLLASAPAFNPGWWSPGMEDSFSTMIEVFIGAQARSAMDEKRTDYLPDLFSLRFKGLDENRPEGRGKEIDVLMTPLSPPDKHGFCSFGHTMWNKRSYAKRAKQVIAEIDENAIRTYGTNYIHISEVDYFVEPEVGPEFSVEEWQEMCQIFFKKGPEEVRAKLRRYPPFALRQILNICKIVGGDFVAPHVGLDEPTEAAIDISHYLGEIINDGDTFQVGVGRPSSFMVKLGVFDNKVDLGIHTEMGCPGLPLLVREGVATGKYKTLHPAKAVFSTFMGCDADDIDYVADNPAFEQYDTEYVANIRTVAQHDNMVAINNSLQVDLTGQICSETQFGPRMINGQGGQTETHIGALLARGGRAITLLPSTAIGGSVSTIVPQLEKGSLVTIPRQFADIIVTEYGVARLLDKSHRERAEELIAIAHPDFRAELRKEAQTLFYPQ